MDRERPRPLPFHLLEKITDYFSEDRKLGAGAYGSVYKGICEDGEIIAVKKLHSMPGLNDQQFQKEYLNVVSLQHENIVRLVGYCYESHGEYIEKPSGSQILAENQYMALCFEYMCNKTLNESLQDESKGHDWNTRYKIIKGICNGLKYLHEEQNPPIFHLDLKPANILLDENMTPKIADFGLSKFYERTQVTASNIGTWGYLPPEYINNKIVSNKLDIFSLGVIIIKIMTGHTGYSQIGEMSSQEFIDHVHVKWRNKLQETPTDEVDSYVKQVKTCIRMALNCVDANRHKRPSIGHIIAELDETETMTQFSQALRFNPGSRSLEEQEENEILEVHPRQLCFHSLEPNKFTWRLGLSNNTDDEVAFRIIPKLHENSMYGLSELNGIVPPRSTQSYCVLIKKQPPTNMHEFAVTLESCIARKDVTDLEDNFLPKVVELTEGNKVRKEDLMAAICDPCDPLEKEMTSERIKQTTPSEKTKVICRVLTEGELLTIDVHPTEAWILASYNGGGIAIWNYQTQKRVTSLEFLSGMDKFRCAKFIARKHWFLAGDWNGWIHVRACVTNDEVKKFKAHDSVVISLAVHPSEPLLLSSSADRHIKIWNWEADWKCITKLKAHSGFVEKVVFNPIDSNFFASVGLDNTLKIWNWKTSSSRPVTTLDCREHQLSVDYFYPGGDREYIVTGSVSGKARIWDVKTNTCIRQIDGLQDKANSRCVGVLDCFPGRQLLVTTLKGDVISVYNFDTDGYEDIFDFKLGRVCNVAYVKDIKSVAIGFSGGIATMVIN